MSVNKETNKVLKKYKCPSGQETLFRSHKNWIRDTQIIPIINQIEGSIKSLKEGWSNSRFRRTGFNMDHPYLKLWELLITQKKEIEDFYNNIKMVENREGKTYKIKDEVSMYSKEG